jgi:hypothetical protein
MAIRNDHDDDDWVSRRNLRHHLHGEEEYSAPPQLGDTLFELALMLVGFVGVIFLITAVLGALR